jgi:hypothetical protein
MLAIMMLIVPNLVLAGTKSQIQPRWSYIYDCAHSLERVGSSSALALYADVQVFDGYYAAVEAQLQKYNSSTGKWNNVSGKFWDIASESDFCYVDEPRISVSSGTYRFDLTFVAYNTSWFELEHFSCYTDQVTIP